MKIISKKCAIELTRKEIKELMNLKTDSYMDNRILFDNVYNFIQAFAKSKVLGKKELDMLWNEMRELTK